MTTLFDPISIGPVTCPNRIWMAPLTRGRGTRDHIPTELMATYYSQRAGAGLIISEATGISVEGSGWPYAGGLWGREHVDHWRVVTQAVHRAGGRIFAQLWHMGRLVHPSLHGVQPVSASATTAPGKAHTYDGKQPYAQARPLGIEEIPRLIGDYVTAARNAIDAGFDGVELHGANGYLIDQFLRDGSNRRTDRYGGTAQNRARFLIEVIEAIVGEWGVDRVGVRLSPTNPFNGMADSNPAATFATAIDELNRFGLAYLHIVEPAPSDPVTDGEVPDIRFFRNLWRGALMGNKGYDLARANTVIQAGWADLVSF